MGLLEKELMTKYFFTPPTEDEGPAGGNVLFYRYKIARGITVVKNNGVYSETRYPSQDELLESDAYYLGGRRHEITSEEYTALTNAGYSDYLETE